MASPLPTSSTSASSAPAVAHGTRRDTPRFIRVGDRLMIVGGRRLPRRHATEAVPQEIGALNRAARTAAGRRR